MGAEARVAAAKVVKVTCLEDRARVERRTQVALPAGATRLVVPDVAPTAVDRSLKVEVSGARLSEARVAREWKQKPAGGLAEDASALRKKVHALEREREALAAEQARLSARLEVTRASREDLLRAISEGTAEGTCEPQPWREALARIRETEAQLDETLRQRQLRHDRVGAELTEARAALARVEAPPAELTARVELVVDAPAAAEVQVTVSYLVPCAVWRPAYRAALKGSGAGFTVRLETEAVVWQRTGETWSDIELALSTARPTLGATPPALVDDVLHLRDKTQEERQSVEVAIREEEIHTTGAASTQQAAELPGVDDGGEVRVLTVPGRVTVPSDGQPHRFALSAFEAAAQVERVCTPELSSAISQVARFPNSGAHVLLAGPVELVRHSGVVGRGRLRFAAQGEPVRLSFGSEDGLRVAREVSETYDESRLTGRRTTVRKVKLFASNAAGQPARLTLEERLLVSEVKEVQVKLREKESAPIREVTPDGIVRFDLALAPNEHKALELVYEVSAAGKVAGL